MNAGAGIREKRLEVLSLYAKQSDHYGMAGQITICLSVASAPWLAGPGAVKNGAVVRFPCERILNVE
jgi:hypothetical protein